MAWIRSGFWVTTEAQNILEIKNYKEKPLSATETIFIVRMKKKEVMDSNKEISSKISLYIRVSESQVKVWTAWTVVFCYLGSITKALSFTLVFLARGLVLFGFVLCTCTSFILLNSLQLNLQNIGLIVHKNYYLEDLGTLTSFLVTVVDHKTWFCCFLKSSHWERRFCKIWVV